jgi:hypothetical protein
MGGAHNKYKKLHLSIVLQPFVVLLLHSCRAFSRTAIDQRQCAGTLCVRDMYLSLALSLALNITPKLATTKLNLAKTWQSSVPQCDTNASREYQ